MQKKREKKKKKRRQSKTSMNNIGGSYLKREFLIKKKFPCGQGDNEKL